MCGWQVKLGDRLVTHGPYMSALEIKGLLKRYINLSVYFFLLFTALHAMQARSSDENSVCPSVCPSVRLSVRHTRAL